jgi:hypothetical protein
MIVGRYNTRRHRRVDLFVPLLTFPGMNLLELRISAVRYNYRTSYPHLLFEFRDGSFVGDLFSPFQDGVCLVPDRFEVFVGEILQGLQNGLELSG